MTFYLTFRQINEMIAQIRRRSGRAPKAAEAVQELYRRHRYVEHASNLGLISVLAHEDDEKFLDSFQELYIEWGSQMTEKRTSRPAAGRNAEVQKEAQGADSAGGRGADPQKEAQGADPAGDSQRREAAVFLGYVFPGARPTPYPDDSVFEVDYIYAGTWRFTYEGKEYLLRPGDLCIISPSAKHDLCEALPESKLPAAKEGGTSSAEHDLSGTPREGERYFLIQMFMNREMFHSTFIALLSDDNILSNFFKDILTNPKRSNFLLLSCGSSPNFSYIQRLAKDIFLEQFKYDDYAPECTSNLLKLLFASVLRSHHDSFQFDSGRTDIDFVPVLNYIARNYRTTSLGEIAEVFHYSESHLSTCIRQMTGRTYTEMVRSLKMRDAVDYLLRTDKPVEEISLLVGYRTPDTFSRAFRQTWGVSPSQYRREHRAEM